MKRAIVGSFVLSLSAAGLAIGQESPQPATVPGAGASATVEFRAIDRNNDGRLSTAEVESHQELRSSFATLDSDHDSYLTQSEYAKWNKAGKMAPPEGAPTRPATPSPSPEN